MSRKKKPLPPSLSAWVTVRTRHKLSHAQVQMARELGMNPKTLGKTDNHDQEPWKLPLPLFIEDLYLKRFGKERPERILTVEQIAQEIGHKKEAKRHRKAERKKATAGHEDDVPF